MAYNMYPCVVF